MEGVPQGAAAHATGGGEQVLVGDALGVPCFVGDLAAATERVVTRAQSGSGGYAVLCNVHVLTTALKAPALREALDHAWTVFPDGAPVAWLLRRTGWPAACRIGGPDLMPSVLDRGRSTGLRHFLFGSTPEVLEALVVSLQADFPGVAVVGSLAPPVGAENEPEHLAAVADAQADVLWVALGAPKQELWMRRHSGSFPGVLMLGVGAAFDFHARTKRRAPAWMQRTGLEWLHRLASEPRRLLVRYVTTNSRFVAAATRQVVRSRRR